MFPLFLMFSSILQQILQSTGNQWKKWEHFHEMGEGIRMHMFHVKHQGSRKTLVCVVLMSIVLTLSIWLTFRSTFTGMFLIVHFL